MKPKKPRPKPYVEVVLAAFIAVGLARCSILSQLPPIVIHPSPVPSATPSAAPLPTPSAAPSPSPSPVTEPAPSPSPVATPSPTPDPEPGLEACRRVPAPGRVCNQAKGNESPDCGCYVCAYRTNYTWQKKPECPVGVGPLTPAQLCEKCWRCDDLLQYQTGRGHLTVVPSQGPRGGNLWTNAGEYYDEKCNRVTIRGEFIADPSGLVGDICYPYQESWCNPASAPAPSPTPSPSPGPTPTPLPSAPPKSGCSADYAAHSLDHVSIQLHDIQDKSNLIKEGYLGVKLVFNTTPASIPPYCAHTEAANGGVQNNHCEQLLACQDPDGSDAFQTLPGHYENDVLESNSTNQWIKQHVPLADETGPTTFTACPRGVRPPSSLCRSITIDVQAGMRK